MPPVELVWKLSNIVRASVEPEWCNEGIEVLVRSRLLFPFPRGTVVFALYLEYDVNAAPDRLNPYSFYF